MSENPNLPGSQNEANKAEKLSNFDKVIGIPILAATVIGLTYGAHAGLEHMSDEQSLNREADEQTRKDLITSGSKLTLKNGKIVVLNSIEPTERQLAKADENVGFSGYPDVSKPFSEHSSTRHSSSLGFLGPRGISPVPIGVPLSINSESRVDTIKIKRHPSEDEIEQLSELYVASTEPVENVGAELVFDKDGPDSIVLKVYYGEGSPESVDLLLVAGNEK